MQQPLFDQAATDIPAIGLRRWIWPVSSWTEADHRAAALQALLGIDKIVLVCAFVVGAVLRLWNLNAVGFNTDEAVYAGQAAGIIGDPGLKPFFPVFRAHPLVFQFLVSIPFRWGVSDLTARLCAVAVGMLTIYLVYLLGKLMYGARAGAVAALLFALIPYHVIVSRQMLLDGPMTLFATLSLYMLARYATTHRPEWLYCTGAALGLTFLAKETGIIVITAMYAFLALTPQIKVRIRDLFISIVCMVLVILPFPLSLAFAGGGGSRTAQSYLVWQLFRRPNHTWTFYPSTVTFAIGPLVLLAALAGLWFARERRSWREVLLVAWILVPALFFQIWPVKGFQYLLPIAPAVVLLASRALVLLSQPDMVYRGLRRFNTNWLWMVGVVVIAVSLIIPAWTRIQPSTTGQFLAGSGGVPGGREAGRWIAANVPENAQFLTIGPSMANILQFYGHRKAYGISVSPNPLHRNPAYEPVINPDYRIRTSEIQYLVFDTFSASRSVFFGNSIMRYVERYNGRVVHTESVQVRSNDGTIVSMPVITIYEVRP